MYCSQLLWLSLINLCYFGFRSSCFDSESMIIADSLDCWVTATIVLMDSNFTHGQQFLSSWTWSIVRVLMAGGEQKAGSVTSADLTWRENVIFFPLPALEVVQNLCITWTEMLESPRSESLVLNCASMTHIKK